jgi:hypothetical protein
VLPSVSSFEKLVRIVFFSVKSMFIVLSLLYLLVYSSSFKSDFVSK